MSSTLFKKELIQQAIIPSNYMVFAVTLGLILFLFFNTFYEVNVASLDGLFGLFPWLLALIVPAFTMGSIAGERHTKTLNFLFAHAISELSIILSKVIAYSIVLSLCIGFTVIVPMIFGSVATFDWGIILAGYGATVLLIIFLVSVDVFFSSITTSQFAAFLLSFVGNVLLILMGTLVVHNLLPQFLIRTALELSPIEHYIRMSSGNILLSDIGYFLFISMGFVCLSVIMVSRLRGKPYQRFHITRNVMHVLAVLFIVAGISAQFIPGSIDVTKAGYFTLSSGTKAILDQVKEPITLRLYVTENLPPAFSPRLDDIKRVLSEISRYSSTITQESKRPEKDDTIAIEAQGKGIFPQRFTVVSQTELSAQQGYLGLEVATQNDSRVIPFIEQTDDFEFQVMQFVHDLTTTGETIVTYTTESESSSQTLLTQLLPTQYEITASEVNSLDVSGDIIILHALATPLTEEYRLRLRELVVGGSSLIVFDDGMEVNLKTGVARPKDSIVVNELLAEWGVSIQPVLMDDKENNSLVPFNTGYGTMVLPYSLWPLGQVNQEVPLFTGIETVSLPWVSSLEITDQSKRMGVLVTTSETSGVIRAETSILPDGVIGSSEVNSRPVISMRSRGSVEGSVVVVGSSQVLSETFARISQNNALFLSNLIEIASQDRSLALIRSKNRTPSELTFASSEQKQILRLGSIGGIPLIIVVGGGLVWYARRVRSKNIYVVSRS